MLLVGVPLPDESLFKIEMIENLVACPMREWNLALLF